MKLTHQNDFELGEILWNYNCLSQPVTPADVIIGFGSHDLRVAQRAAELFLADMAPLILFTGNRGRSTENLWDKSEAEMFAQEAIKLCVPKDNILLEPRATNSGENILFSKQLLEEKLIKHDSIILVQKPYMERRVLATCLKIWPTPKYQVTSPQISYKNYPNHLIDLNELINVMVGDTQRVKEYPAKGFQIPQEMPKITWETYEALVKRGYTKHLI